MLKWNLYDEMNQPSILIVVPARGGSKRLPRKNLSEVGGRTLLTRVADFLRDEQYLDQAIVSTDDQEIVDEAIKAGLRVPFLRPAELGSDIAPTIDVVCHAISCEGDRSVEFVAVLQLTSPFRRKGLLKDALKLLQETPRANAVVAMERLHVQSEFVFTRTTQGYAERLTSEEGALTWVPTGSLYLARKEACLDQKSLFPLPIIPIETPEVEAIDIDDFFDLKLAQILARFYDSK